LWLLLFIYFRTALKLVLGKGALSRRILPEYSSPIDANIFQKLIRFLDRTHIYFGIGSVAVILLHIALMGIPMDILFFPAAIFLVVWQGAFGLFISWRYTPKELKKLSYPCTVIYWSNDGCICILRSRIYRQLAWLSFDHSSSRAHNKFLHRETTSSRSQFSAEQGVINTKANPYCLITCNS
jgi:hypothetical protein